ncbi:hypothetical protein DFJ43DRAFT_1141834 [Lentinula guzmanii]|uniref:Uncharacterized protein n=1 Tax=Lentinula guzmanii TaxID=2804957 RepID=A0AA38JEI2_9AGAR|nr:hypothetical protein DFJ43DRAFT_1141834 [Lentinula guzmanii]
MTLIVHYVLAISRSVRFCAPASYCWLPLYLDWIRLHSRQSATRTRRCIIPTTFPNSIPTKRPPLTIPLNIEMAVGLAKLDLVSVFVECVLYGFFALLAIIAFSIVLQRRRIKHQKPRGTLRILFAVLVMFLLATVHLSVHFHRTLYAFFGPGSSNTTTEKINSIGKVDGILVSIGSVGYTLKTTSYYLQTYIYRVYVVWSGNTKVMVPLIVSFLASIGLSIYVLQEMGQAAHGDTIFESRLYDSILSFFVVTLFTNLGSTILIAGRIHWLHSQVKDASRVFVSCPLFGTSARAGCSAIFVATVISESAAIYSATLVVILILYALKIHIVYVLIDAATQLIGIVFAFVVIRVAIGVSTEATPPVRPVDEPDSSVSLSEIEDKSIILEVI